MANNPTKPKLLNVNTVKTRRGLKKRGYDKVQGKLSIFGNNCDGIKHKIESLKLNVASFSPSIVTLQETKLKSKNSFKLPGYQFFERLRCQKDGGGLLTAIDENLDPALVFSDEESLNEILIVQLELNNLKIRVINAYGPQEDEDPDIVQQFWIETEQHLINAMDNDCCVILQLDANAKVGQDIIKWDVNPMSSNGKRLIDMVSRLNLCIVNSLDKCDGLITRERSTVTGIERSILDYVITCDRLRECLDYMMIDDERDHVLTKHTSDGVRKKVVSDHNVLFCSFTLKYSLKRKSTRKEIFLLKDKAAQEAFFKSTSVSETFSSIFSMNNSFEHNANIFFGELKRCIFRNFKKVRVISGGKKPRKLDNY